MIAKPRAAHELLSQEVLLLDVARQIGRHREGRRAVHIHLSRLKPHNRRDHHLRIAVNSFENLVRLHDGHRFSLANADMVFICRAASAGEVEAAIQRLRFLFGEDPLTQAEGLGGLGRFCTWYDLEAHYDEFLRAAEALAAAAERRRSDPDELAKARANALIEPMGAGVLGKVQEVLASADLSNVIRRQAVCAIVDKAPPKPIFRELFVSIADLQRVVAPKLNLAANRWLFQHLTETLDKRMLATLPKYNDASVGSHFSLNLNVSTLLSPEFLTFDGLLRSSARGTVVIELQPIDVLADMSAFRFAREFARERSYRLCLDGITDLTAEMLDREALGFELMKIIWNPDLVDDPGGRRAAKLKATVERWGGARVILCRCDNADAIAFGQSAGIHVFQGRHVDALLSASQKPTAVR